MWFQAINDVIVNVKENEASPHLVEGKKGFKLELFSRTPFISCGCYTKRVGQEIKYIAGNLTTNYC